MGPVKQLIQIYGLIKEPEFFKAKVTAEGLMQRYSDNFEEPKCVGMLEHNWLHFLEESKQRLGGKLWSYQDTTLVLLDDKVLGSAEEFLKWSSSQYDFQDFRPLPLFHALAKQEYKEYLLNTKHEFIFMDISIGKEKSGRLLIQLFNDMLPKTCENFKQLSIGDKEENEHHQPAIKLSYRNTIFHRIVKKGWIQGGDIVRGKGNDGWSIYGESFADENYSIKHDRRGIIGMANKGRHSNASQFYITLQKAPWMDCQYVAIGEIIEGFHVLDKLEMIETYNERPLQDCVITDCGVFDVNSLYT